MKTLNFRESKHLVERSGIGAELERIQSFSGKSLDSAIIQIVSADTKSRISSPALLKPFKAQKIKKAFRKSGNRKKANQLFKDERVLLMNWGLQNLLDSENPLHERMVWFWHNHFTSSVKKVRIADWMLRQDLLIRKNALGNFSELLKIMAFEPAMLIYLDGKSNKKGQANENFARELLELFTLGEGNYTEQDIKEAARAFTGWGVSLKKDKAVFRKKFHDKGVKTFMGKTGTLNGNDILSILLSQPRTAELICEKLWDEFISIEAPDSKVIKSWAAEFQSTGYDIFNLLKTIFKSESFWSEKNQGALIKSPIDIIVGSLRTLEMEDGDLPLALLQRQLKRMGQELYTPPNVKGWEGGKAWVDDVRLPIRQRFLERLTRGKTGVGKNRKNNNMAMKMEKKQKMPLPELPNLAEQQWSEWLLAVPPITNIVRKKPQARLRVILLDPAYQLK